MASILATWGGGPHKSQRPVQVPASLCAAAKPGMKVRGSELHGIAFALQPAVMLSDLPADDLPELAHSVILTDKLKDELETFVIEPTFDRDSKEVLVVFTGITGAGKTTAKEYCVSQIAQRCGGKIAYWDVSASDFRKMYWGESEASIRHLFETAHGFGKEGYVVVVSMEDAESALTSRNWSQQSTSGCGSTAAATTSELLRGLEKLAKARIQCTVLTSSNYFAFDFDPALMASHRLRGYIRFATLALALAPEVVSAHAANLDVAEGVSDWVSEAFCTPTVLARGKQNGSLCEVTLEDCLTPSIIAGVFHRARLFSRRATVQVEHAARAFAFELDMMANKIAAHGRPGGEIGMLVPRLVDAGALALKPVFDPAAVTADAALDAALTPA